MPLSTDDRAAYHCVRHAAHTRATEDAVYLILALDLLAAHRQHGTVRPLHDRRLDLYQGDAAAPVAVVQFE